MVCVHPRVVMLQECLYNNRRCRSPQEMLLVQQLYALQPDLLHLLASQKPPICLIVHCIEDWILSVIQASISAF